MGGIRIGDYLSKNHILKGVSRMREIKFRAWDKKDKVIRDVLKIGFYATNCIRCEWHKNETENSTEMYERTLFDGEYELMQYTGLKDNNGVEIFEGDIVRAYHLVGESEVREIFPNDFDFFAFVDHGNCKLEVLGNIHEHPELLEVD